jgi:hypothetical protein
MPPEALAKLKEKLTAIDNAVTIQDLKKAVEAMLQFSVNLQNKTENDLQAIKTAVDGAIVRIKNDAIDDIKEIKKEFSIQIAQQFSEQVDAQMSKMLFEHESRISEMDAKMDAAQEKIEEAQEKIASIKNGQDGEDGADGQDADEQAVIDAVLKKIPKVDISGIQQDVSAIKNNLENLHIDNIAGWKDSVHKLVPGETLGATRGFALKVGGVKKGLVNEVNFTGSGVVHSLVNGLPTITITGGSGATYITPNETPNGNITVFTFPTATAQPSYIWRDGTRMKATAPSGTVNWTWNAGAKTATLSIPANDDCYGEI